MLTLAVAIQKGGTGKTATVWALASILAGERGRRVLCVDADPQASLTHALGVTPAASLADVLGGAEPGAASIPDIIRNAIPRLDLAPASVALAACELALTARFGRERVLDRALEVVGGAYDYCLIDCPTSLGLLTINALTAAAGVLVPVQAGGADLPALALFLATVEKIRAALNPRLELVGVLPTFYDPRTRHTRAALESMQRAGLHVLSTRIPRSVRVAEAMAARALITDYIPDHKTTHAYRQLADEVETWRKSKPT